MAADHAHDDHDEHDHGTLHYQGTEATAAALESLRGLHPKLAELLDLTNRYAELTDEEKQKLPELQRAVEHHVAWTPGYHSPGDKCATCGKPTTVLFTDKFQEGALPYGAFVSNLPVHAAQVCLDGFRAARPNLAPQAVDRARRELVKDLNRPSAGMSQFFRHDLLAHPAFGLEDWANSVAAANPNGLDRTTTRDIERLVHWVHGRLFHHHA